MSPAAPATPLMNAIPKDELRYCRLCSREIPESLASEFCCSGCERVAQLIQASPQNENNGALPVADLSDFALPQTPPISFYVEGIHCSSCVWILERLPMDHPEHVARATLNLGQSILEVQLRPGARISDVPRWLQDLGYTAHRVENAAEAQRHEDAENRARLIDVGVAGALAGNVMLMSIPLYSGISGALQGLFEWISLGLAIPSVFYSGRSFFTNVMTGVRTRAFPIDGPILLAILVAFGVSAVSVIQGTHTLYFDSLTTLVFLLLASRYYLARLRKSSNRSLGLLDHFQGKTQARVGDVLGAEVHDRLAFDGVVVAGSVMLDLSHLSGESVPVEVPVGGMVFAGARVMDRSESLKLRVLAVDENTRLAGLLKKIKESQELKSAAELQSDVWAKHLLKFVLGFAVVLMVAFTAWGQWTVGLQRVLTLLIVTCPCALALATPLAYAVAIRKLLRRGLLIKDPQALDEAKQVQKVFFDKTGTLTWGKPMLQGNLQGWTPVWLSRVYAIASRSRHPVSRALVFALSESQTEANGGAVEVLTWKEVPGLGIHATIRDIEGEIQLSLVKAAQSQSGNTEVVLQKTSAGQSIEVGRFAFHDQVRESSLPAIEVLRKMKIDVAILSGDQIEPAQRVGQQLLISEVLAQQSPEQKAEKLQKWQSEHSGAALMVGDGLNDALSLTQARVSVAVQGGIDAAIQSSQVVSLVPGIETVPILIQMSRNLSRVLKVNFFYSTAYNVLGAALAVTGIMNPLIAAVLMPISATTVFVATLWNLRDSKIEEALCKV